MASTPATSSWARHARAEGFTSLRDDAVRYVLAGHTTVEEVSRVVNLAAH